MANSGSNQSLQVDDDLGVQFTSGFGEQVFANKQISYAKDSYGGQSYKNRDDSRSYSDNMYRSQRGASGHSPPSAAQPAYFMSPEFPFYPGDVSSCPRTIIEATTIVDDGVTDVQLAVNLPPQQ
ncbi:hypothetical protein V6N12_074635 [Hibiscus sabdariffa]|uniref:Uncharacterized protein n=1 Tax=Hibiscus sabdariffa TaxID=183260 RepID=A0ABR2BXZ2_9ROSI